MAKESLKWYCVSGLLLAIFVVAWTHQTMLMKLAQGGVLFIGMSVLASRTERMQQFWQFIKESRKELLRVVWPKRDETVRMSILVILAVAITGVMIWLVDQALVRIIGVLTGNSHLFS